MQTMKVFMTTKVFSRLVSIVLLIIIGGFAFLKFSPDYNIYLVRSESMKPAINIGDMIVTGPVNGPINGEVKPERIITYKQNKALVTHRVLSIDGESLVTKGDAAEDPDPWSATMASIKGVYLFKIPGVGYMAQFIRTRTGWFLVVLFPAALLVGLLVKDIVKEALSEA